MQACSQQSGRFLDAKFQNMWKNKDSPLHNCLTLSVTPLLQAQQINFLLIYTCMRCLTKIPQNSPTPVSFVVALLPFSFTCIEK